MQLPALKDLPMPNDKDRDKLNVCRDLAAFRKWLDGPIGATP